MEVIGRYSGKEIRKRKKKKVKGRQALTSQQHALKHGVQTTHSMEQVSMVYSQLHPIVTYRTQLSF